MRDVNGVEVRAGQRVRVTFEGVLLATGALLHLGGPPDGNAHLLGVACRDGAPVRPWGTVEVLAEPRIPEPTGLGAVVRDGEGVVRIRIDRAHSPWRSLGGMYREWDYIPDPVLLSAGWTDGE